MEQKLKTFKNLKSRKNILSIFSQFFQEINSKSTFKNKYIEDVSDVNLSDSLSVPTNLSEGGETNISSLTPSDDSILMSVSKISFLTILNYFLYLFLWIIIYLIAVQLEFGFVYFILSCLFFIYYNTRTEPKKKGEISAYSVFNPGCRAIEGTLKAEQLEKEFNLILHK